MGMAYWEKGINEINNIFIDVTIPVESNVKYVYVEEHQTYLFFQSLKKNANHCTTCEVSSKRSKRRLRDISYQIRSSVVTMPII